MKKVIFALTAVILGLSISCSCFAQYSEGARENKWGIGFGLFHPVDENLRKYRSVSPAGADDNWVDIRVSYTIQKDAEERPVSFLALDWIAQPNSFSGLRMSPVTYNMVFRPEKGKFGNMFFTAGAGVFPIKFKALDLNQFKSFESTKVGVALGGGVEFNKTSRLSLNYWWVPDVDGGRYTAYFGGPVLRAKYSFSGASLTYTVDVF